MRLSSWSVGELAALAKVSVRTLHHYDEIGLLRPSGRTDKGYRLYATSDLARLQRILCYRDLGFDLPAIAIILDDPSIDELDHLRRQRDRLGSRIGALQQMVITVEKMMEARQMGINLNPDEMFEVFGDEDPTQHAEEAEQRWGDTDAYRESHRRTSKYTKDDWQKIKAEAEEIVQLFIAAEAGGAAADSREAMDIAEQHRAHISRWFYPCSYEMHRGLGDMYIADARFAAHYDERQPGLAGYVRTAIHANADTASNSASLD